MSEKPCVCARFSSRRSKITKRVTGVYVTTSIFSEPAQVELAEDKYPLVLVNGKRLVQVLEQATVSEGLSLRELLDRETEWYRSNERPYSAGRILDDSVFGSQADVVAAKSMKAAAK